MTQKARILCYLALIYVAFAACNNLKPNQIVKVTHVSEGDFGGRITTVSIFQKSDSIYATLAYDDKEVENKLITLSQLDSFGKFIVTLRNLPASDGLCSTSIYCTVKTRTSDFRKDNISCSWSGFSDLMNNLGLNPN